MSVPGLDADSLRAIRRQRRVSHALAFLWVPAVVVIMRWALAWRIENADELRETYRRVRSESPGPLLICANHLTMLDSFVVGWALSNIRDSLTRFETVPWNTPERTKFAASFWSRALVYMFKCIPIVRGADRGEVAKVLAKVNHLLANGESVLIFPEGGRSRTGRVDVDNAAYGVGRMVNGLPGCRVLCLYLRGEGQHTWSTAPRRGERFRGQTECFEPKTDHRGLRGSLDVARQIVTRLAAMEDRHFEVHGGGAQRSAPDAPLEQA